MSNMSEFCTVSLERVKKAIKNGNKIITIIPKNSRCTGFIKQVVEVDGDTYVTIDVSEERYPGLYFKNPSNEKVNAKDLAYWIEEEESFYNYNGDLEAPF